MIREASTRIGFEVGYEKKGTQDLGNVEVRS
jgi:hypothetical protein